jgi:hypothetical protein
MISAIALKRENLSNVSSFLTGAYLNDCFIMDLIIADVLGSDPYDR